jgi:ABC-type Na+ efflux pump permease subunit
MTPAPGATPAHDRGWRDDARLILVIARRAALESLRDRMTVVMSLLFALVMPIGLVVAVLRPLALAESAAAPEGLFGRLLVFYVLLVGLLPSSAAIGIAAGQFAGEKEQGSLAPLLASPASNVAIFGGKVLGSIIPPTVFSIVAELVYLVALVVVVGPGALRLIAPPLVLPMVVLVPATALFAATVASLISSRVRTYNAAQQIGGLALVPFWATVFPSAFQLLTWGPWALAIAALGLIALDVVLVLLAAATWRREEVLAQR